MNFEETIEDPIDCVEWVAVESNWDFKRLGPDEALLTIPGEFATFDFCFSWAADHSILMTSCDFALSIPDSRRSLVREITCRVNEHLTVGHFDVWPREEKVRHRQSLFAGEFMLLNSDQLEAMIIASLRTCDQYFTTFQLAASSRLSPAEVLEITLLRPTGTA